MTYDSGRRGNESARAHCSVQDIIYDDVITITKMAASMNLYSEVKIRRKGAINRRNAYLKVNRV